MKGYQLNGMFGLLLAVLCFAFGGTESINAQSALDGFDPNANGTVFAVVVQPDGKILVGGDFTSLSPNGGSAVTRNRIARLNPDGTLDTGFNPDANDFVTSIAVQTNGQVLIGGVFTSVGAQPRNRIARLDAVTGAVDLSFDPNANGDVETIVVQPDNNKVLVGGAFTTLTPNGGSAVPRNRIARLETSGLVDTFDPNANGSVFSMALQSDSRILTGGAFTSLVPNGGATVPRNCIARLETDGTVDASFNPNANNSVFSIAVQLDGNILAGGAFTNIGGQPRNFIARLLTTGTAEVGFNPDAGDFVLSVVVETDGNILAAGFFNTIGGQMRNFIARLNAVTGAAELFNPNANGVVRVAALQSDAKVVIGGDFTTIGITPRNSIARFGPFAPTAASVSVSGRVFGADGRGLRNAVVVLTDAHGVSRNAITSAFGYYRFEDVAAGQTVVVSVRSKRYQFAPQVVGISEAVRELNFFPE